MNKNQWITHNAKALDKIKSQTLQRTEQRHFDKKRLTRVNANHKAQSSTLEQFHPNGWFLIAYARCFQNTAKQIYSTNEHQLLAVVGSREHFPYDLYNSEFELVTNHKALLSALKTNRSDKSRHSRLKQWVDCRSLTTI